MNWLGNFFNKILDKETPEYIDQEYLLTLEETLLKSDCGFTLTEYLLQDIDEDQKITKSQTSKLIQDKCVDILNKTYDSKEVLYPKELNIIFVTGVNGAGKTTSIAKLIHKFNKENAKVLVAPCDTFRAASYEQLQSWLERVNADMIDIKLLESAKASNILYNSIQKAYAENYKYLIIDTAGRLQAKQELMDELNGFHKVITKHTDSDTTHIHHWLVLDATNGQNGYLQAEEFNKISPLTGIILTKFDGISKGGIILSIAHNLGIPIRYLGYGETLDAIKEFNPKEYMEKLL